MNPQYSAQTERKMIFSQFCTKDLQHLRTKSAHLLLKFDSTYKSDFTKEVCNMADKENYYIPVEGKLVEVEEPVYTEYYRMSRRERYLEERDKEIGVLSYDALDNNGLVGQEMFQDRERGTLEDMAMARELLEQLHRCIGMLPKAEQELIHAIYFEGMRDTEYARKVRMSQSGVSRKHKKTLSKLRFLMNFIGSF